MNTHEYSPREALELLLRKLGDQDEQLAHQIQSAIDAGKDVVEKDSSVGRRKQRVYRRTVRFTDEEALNVAIDALQACFIEQQLFVASAKRYFAPAAVGGPVDRGGDQGLLFGGEGIDRDKTLEVELQTETKISIEAEQTFPLAPTTEQQIDQQRENVSRLRSLTTFG